MDGKRVLINFRLSAPEAKRLRVASKMAEKTIQEIMETAVSDYLAAREAGQAQGLAAFIEEARR
jgi:hypothetical protein